MNIFFLSYSPIQSARFLADIHVGSKNTGGKMIVESTQMLANCYTTEQLAHAPKTKKGETRKYSYYNHCCSKWVRESIYNFNWLLEHAIEMVNEKMYRGGNLHFCHTFLDWCRNNPPNLNDPYNTTSLDLYQSITSPALAMPEIYKNNDPIVAYRRYYNEYKRNTIQMKWTRRDPPKWWYEN